MKQISSERVRFTFSGSVALLNLLRRAQEILRHKFPGRELELIFMEALEVLLNQKDPERLLRAKQQCVARPRARPPSAWAFTSRHIPLAVKDAVWRRDRGQCVYLMPEGLRCPELGGLEYDHIVAFALGGPSNDPKNIRLLCKTHNLLCARRQFAKAAYPPRWQIS